MRLSRFSPLFSSDVARSPVYSPSPAEIRLLSGLNLTVSGSSSSSRSCCWFSAPPSRFVGQYRPLSAPPLVGYAFHISRFFYDRGVGSAKLSFSLGGRGARFGHCFLVLICPFFPRFHWLRGRRKAPPPWQPNSLHCSSFFCFLILPDSLVPVVDCALLRSVTKAVPSDTKLWFAFSFLLFPFSPIRAALSVSFFNYSCRSDVEIPPQLVAQSPTSTTVLGFDGSLSFLFFPPLAPQARFFARITVPLAFYLAGAALFAPFDASLS